MYNHPLHQQVKEVLQSAALKNAKADNEMAVRLIANAADMQQLFQQSFRKSSRNGLEVYP